MSGAVRRLGALVGRTPRRRRGAAPGRGLDLVRERRLRPGPRRRPSTTSSCRPARARPSFEADGNVLDGWVVPAPRRDGQPAQPEQLDRRDRGRADPGCRALGAQQSFDRQPEIIALEADTFGPYPFSASGGIVDNVDVGFALENQTRPTYSPFFFGPNQGNDFVVVHELAHQWFGDSLAVDTWQNIWLNEGFATYAEWLWSEREGHGHRPAELRRLRQHPGGRRLLVAGDRRSGAGPAVRLPGLCPRRDDAPRAAQARSATTSSSRSSRRGRPSRPAER